jgi:hypothetical protein
MVLADGFAVLDGDAKIQKGDPLEVMLLKPLSTSTL